MQLWLTGKTPPKIYKIRLKAWVITAGTLDYFSNPIVNIFPLIRIHSDNFMRATPFWHVRGVPG